MKTTLVVFPMEDEFKELLPKLTKYKKVTYKNIEGIEFSTKRAKVFAFVSGVGKTKIGLKIGYLASQLDIKEIYNVGVGASLKEDIIPLTVVVATKAAYYDVDLTVDPKYKFGQMSGEPLYFEADKKTLTTIDKLNTTSVIRTGTVLSGDSFATQNNMTKELLKNFDNPIAVDMESAAVGQAARDLKVPFTIIRGISDYVFAEDNAGTFEEFVGPSARRACSILMHIIDDPFIEEE